MFSQNIVLSRRFDPNFLNVSQWKIEMTRVVVGAPKKADVLKTHFLKNHHDAPYSSVMIKSFVSGTTSKGEHAMSAIAAIQECMVSSFKRICKDRSFMFLKNKKRTSSGHLGCGPSFPFELVNQEKQSYRSTSLRLKIRSCRDYSI